MYVMRYLARFSDQSEFLLFEEAYYNDKRVFWEVHQKNLQRFCEEMKTKGIPIQVKDRETGDIIRFPSTEQFRQWYIDHQSKNWCL